MFSGLEGETAGIFTKLINDSPVTLSNDELKTLAAFIAFLHVRGPSFRQKDINFKIALVERWEAEKAKDPKRFKVDMEKAGVTFDNKAEFEEMRQQYMNGITKHYKFQYERRKNGHILKAMFESAEMLAPIILYKKWEILECTNEVFVTSDNPLTLMKPAAMPDEEVEGFLNLKIVLPFSPSRCLILDRGRVSGRFDVHQADRQRVLNLNRSTMFNAYRELYSNRYSTGIKKAFNRTKDDESEKVHLDDGEVDEFETLLRDRR